MQQRCSKSNTEHKERTALKDALWTGEKIRETIRGAEQVTAHANVRSEPANRVLLTLTALSVELSQGQEAGRQSQLATKR